MLVILIIIALFAIPLSSIIPIQGTNVWYPQYLMFLALAFVGISLALWKFNKFISLFLGYCVYSTFFIAGSSPKAMFTLATIYLAYLAIYGISKLSAKERKWIRWAIVGVLLLQGLWTVLQTYNLDPIFNSTINHVLDDTVGFCGSHNQLGLFFAVTAPIAIFVFPPLLLITLFGLWQATTSFAWVGCFVGLAVLKYRMKWTKEKVLLTIFLLLTMVTFFYKVENFSWDTKGRYYSFRRAIKSVVEGKIHLTNDFYAEPSVRKVVTCNPLLGYGFSKFSSIFPHYKPVGKEKYTFNGVHVRYFHLHNDFLEMFFELGYIGLGLFLFIFGNFLLSVWKNRYNNEALLYASCVIAYCVSALGIFPTHTAISSMWLVIFMGMFYSSVRKK